MKWRDVLTQLPTLLREVVLLLREQNSLMRELIMAVTGRAPSTQPTTPSSISVVRPKLDRKYTADDVSVVTREDRLRQQEEEQVRRVAPHRAPVDPLVPAAETAPPPGDVEPAVPIESPESPPPNPESSSQTAP